MSENFVECWKRIKKLPNVIGYSGKLQPRIRKGRVIRSELCFRVYVTKKLPEVQLNPEHVIPKEICGYSTDVVEIGTVRALNGKEDKTKKFRPLQAGISVGHKDVTAGTLGWYVERGVNVYLLSNNHVLANENSGRKGDVILQPGSYDGGKLPDDVCAKLADFIPISFVEYNCPYRDALMKIVRLFMRAKLNKADVAIAEPTVGYELKFIDLPPVKGVNHDIKVGDEVAKTGRTTCTTVGRIFDDCWNGYVQYSRGTAYFEDQLMVYRSGFSAGGDSGSLIVDDEHKAVGLLFAGSDVSTIANKIKHVEELMGIRVVAL